MTRVSEKQSSALQNRNWKNRHSFWSAADLRFFPESDQPCSVKSSSAIFLAPRKEEGAPCCSVHAFQKSDVKSALRVHQHGFILRMWSKPGGSQELSSVKHRHGTMQLGFHPSVRVRPGRSYSAVP